MLNKRKLNKITKILDPLPSHKVTIQVVYFTDSASGALSYLSSHYKNVAITVLKHREYKMTIEIRCSESTYDEIKFNFVKDVGSKFIWKD